MALTTDFELHILSRSQAARFLMSKTRGPRVRWLISIGEPGEKPPAGMHRVQPRLRLEFDDTDFPTDDLAPTPSDVEKIIRFGRLLPDSGVALVHCQAGISRSSAAAVIAMAAGFPESAPLEIARHIADLGSEFYPNRLMIGLADDLLKLNGALVDAVDTCFPEPEI